MILGLSRPGNITEDMIRSMSDNPIIFACANPTPEIMPDVARAVRDDLIMGTGRSDFPNQVNNVLGFPFIFRGALDVHATKITENMKMAAAIALAKLAKEPVPEYVIKAHNRSGMSFGKEYIIPSPFDKRLMESVSLAVATAAIEDGVARVENFDLVAYKIHLQELSNS